MNLVVRESKQDNAASEKNVIKKNRLYQLEKLIILLRSGVLTDEEFKKRKSYILGHLWETSLSEESSFL